MKYFFLSEGWQVGRIWELGGLWNEKVWRRPPRLQQTNLGIVEQGERLWLYEVEEAVLMVEVKPTQVMPPETPTQSIGQVVLKRLITAEQAIARMRSAETLFAQPPSRAPETDLG